MHFSVKALISNSKATSTRDKVKRLFAIVSIHLWYINSLLVQKKMLSLNKKKLRKNLKTSSLFELYNPIPVDGMCYTFFPVYSILSINFYLCIYNMYVPEHELLLYEKGRRLHLPVRILYCRWVFPLGKLLPREFLHSVPYFMVNVFVRRLAVVVLFPSWASMFLWKVSSVQILHIYLPTRFRTRVFYCTVLVTRKVQNQTLWDLYVCIMY